jgi:threonine dehydratase
MLLLWERTKLVVEPSGAVAAGPAPMKKMDAQGKEIGIILSGGNLDLCKLPFSS